MIGVISVITNAAAINSLQRLAGRPMFYVYLTIRNVSPCGELLMSVLYAMLLPIEKLQSLSHNSVMFRGDSPFIWVTLLEKVLSACT